MATNSGSRGINKPSISFLKTVYLFRRVERQVMCIITVRNHSRLEIQRLSLSRSGPVIWNCLPNYVRNESKRKFKQKIHVLLRKILETEDDYVNVITKKIMKMNVSNLTETIYHNVDYICSSTLFI